MARRDREKRDQPDKDNDDPWAPLRALTAARIALGRAGASVPTRHHLGFQLAHARARDAVHAGLDAHALASKLETAGHSAVVLLSQAPDRITYLQRPDLGRALDASSKTLLDNRVAGRAKRPRNRIQRATSNRSRVFDVAIVIADGLSALAIERHAAPLIAAIVPTLREEGWSLAPISIVIQARVAIGDQIGALLRAEMVVVLIGERPGLSSPDSLGVYLTFEPRVGRTDAERNCISNIRDAGLSPNSAATTLLYLMREARYRRLTGIGLKDESQTPPAPISHSVNFLLGPSRK